MENIKDIGGFINLDLAKIWTNNYRLQHQNDVYAHLLGKDKVMQILTQQDCEGIRIYKALNDEGNEKVILTGVDLNGNDMANGLLVEYSKPCPPACDASSPLA